ncbi:MAG: beta-galactosidase GalA [Tepidisphaeraceae bacterium]
MRERFSLDRGWRFAPGHAADESLDFQFRHMRDLVKAGEARGAGDPKFDDSKWKTVDIPHDWAIELPFFKSDDREIAEHGFRAIGPKFPENSVGWYRRSFEIPASDLGRRVTLEFDGVYRDCVVWVNGHRMGRHESGYTSFQFDLTDFLNYGGQNVIAVRVDAGLYEGWWYEGAGIYRHVWLTKTSPLHVGRWGTQVISEVSGDDATAVVKTTIVNDDAAAATFDLVSAISEANGKAVAEGVTAGVVIEPWSSATVEQRIAIKAAKLWSCESPNLYSLDTTLRQSDAVVDSYKTTFGVRTLRWDKDEGFFLNGKHLKIKGTCNHQQHAGVGIAMPDALHEFRLKKLKELGSNAYRASHYATTPELLDLCDRMGMLVMAENRVPGGAQEHCDQFESMIRRDRNHPSIFLWSLGNEEHTIQWSITGERIGKTMVRLAHRLDPTRAVTTAMYDRGVNEGFVNVVDVHGWNYMNVGDMASWRERNPHQPILGSEEASTVTTRGIYADDKARGYVSAYPKRAPKWGSLPEQWWPYFSERNWLAGGFLWIGFDHYGEPIPYKWPCTSSHFGLMDLCGFPKDIYYYYKSWWDLAVPTVHLFPHWNWEGREGQEIDVWCYSNAEAVELLHNGKSLGRQDVKPNSHVEWKVVYEPGTLEAVGYRDGQAIKTHRIETTGPIAGLRLSVDRPAIHADDADVAVISVAGVDAQGRVVPTACELVRFDLAGPGKLIGVGNGDPSSHESDKTPFRKLFNGYAMAIVQASTAPGDLRLNARLEGGQAASIVIKTEKTELRPCL